MKILFIITNINGKYRDAYSFGLASLASFIREKGFEFEIRVINKIDEYDSIFELIDSFNPRVIGYSSVSSQFMYVKELAQKIRQKYKDKIQVCGGIHPSIYPNCIFETDALDGIFIGESEYGFADFLSKVKNGLPYKDVKNFAYNNNGNLVKNPLHSLIKDLDVLPFPEREKYDYKRFIEWKGGASFIFTRGCPYRCTYCCNHAIAGIYGLKSNMPRYRSPDNCIKEIKEVMSKYEVKRVRIVDDLFGFDIKWTEEFCKKYGSQIKLPLQVLLRVDRVNERLMENLKIAGCDYVFCGIESGNDFIRNKILKRNLSKKQIIKAFKLFKKYKMKSSPSNMIGLPHETESMIWDTIKLNRKIKPNNSGAQIFYPYKGTELGDYCFEKGLVDEERFNDFSNERRDSVLKFSPEYRQKLVYFRANWINLIKNYGIKKFARKHMPKTVAKLAHIRNVMREWRARK